MEEDKKEIVKKLEELLKLTKGASGIKKLTYMESGTVVIEWSFGTTTAAPVYGKSGLAMIREIIGRI